MFTSLVAALAAPFVFSAAPAPVVCAEAQTDSENPPYTVVRSSAPKNQWTKPEFAADPDWRTVFTANERNADGSRKPHFVTLDLGTEQNICGFLYMPPPYTDAGRVRKYQIFTSTDSDYTKGTLINDGEFPFQHNSFWGDRNENFQTVIFPECYLSRYVTFVAVSDHGDSGESSIADFVPIFNPVKYRYKDTSLQKLKGTRMAPSIHMFYPAPPGRLYYLEITPKKSVEGTYFVACGFDGGYFGFQEWANKQKVILFSVWDNHPTNNPTDVKNEDQTKVFYADKAMRYKRFGGEGVGVQSFLDFDWKIDQTYKFCLKIDADPKRKLAFFSSYFFDPDQNTWRHLMTLAQPGNRSSLTGFHSFVEDFKRNFDSFNQVRTLQTGNIWVLRADDQKWFEVREGSFSVDSNPNRNINAGRIPNGFFLTSGGNTVHTQPLFRNFAKGKPAEKPAPPMLPDSVLAPLDLTDSAYQNGEVAPLRFK